MPQKSGRSPLVAEERKERERGGEEKGDEGMVACLRKSFLHREANKTVPSAAALTSATAGQTCSCTCSLTVRERRLNLVDHLNPNRRCSVTDGPESSGGGVSAL